jgi:Na+-transporting NADH:ubiquinone oxidoreductase subunit NqrF
MNMDEFTILLKNKTAKGSMSTAIPAKKGQSLMSALSEKGIFLRADCGGNGRCTKCSVKIIQNSSKKDLENIDETNRNTKTSCRNALACQETVTENLVIEIPRL